MTDKKDYIDQAQEFLDRLNRLGAQLKSAEDQQKCFLARMLELKSEGQEKGIEYGDLDQKSKSLQMLIDKYRPIYLERMEMVREVKAQSAASL